MNSLSLYFSCYSLSIPFVPFAFLNMRCTCWNFPSFFRDCRFSFLSGRISHRIVSYRIHTTNIYIEMCFHVFFLTWEYSQFLIVMSASSIILLVYQPKRWNKEKRMERSNTKPCKYQALSSSKWTNNSKPFEKHIEEGFKSEEFDTGRSLKKSIDTEIFGAKPLKENEKTRTPHVYTVCTYTKMLSKAGTYWGKYHSILSTVEHNTRRLCSDNWTRTQSAVDWGRIYLTETNVNHSHEFISFSRTFYASSVEFEAFDLNSICIVVEWNLTNPSVFVCLCCSPNLDFIRYHISRDLASSNQFGNEVENTKDLISKKSFVSTERERERDGRTLIRT